MNRLIPPVRTIRDRTRFHLLAGLVWLGLAVGMSAEGQTVEELESRARKEPEAAYLLAQRYLHGIEVAADEKKAVGHLKSAASKLPEAAHLLAVCHATGVGTTANERDAWKYFKQAADGGIAEAQYKVGLGYELSLFGQKESLTEAARYYQLGAKQHHAGCHHRMARLFAEHERYERNYARAVEHATQAANAGILDAQILLATLGKLGYLVPGDRQEGYLEALKWYMIAAQQGYPPAEEQVTQMPRSYPEVRSPEARAEAARRANEFVARQQSRIAGSRAAR